MKRTLIAAAMVAAVASAAVVSLGAPARAQDDSDAGSATQEPMMGPGNGKGMMGHGMMGGGGMMGKMGGGCPMMGSMMGGGGPMSMHAKGRLAFLKAELEITDAQEKVWGAYADALKKRMDGMQDMHKQMMAMQSAKTPVERLDARITMMESRLQAMKEMKPALAALYDALTDDQKKQADQLLSGGGMMGGMMQ